jgi:hypothetical protein
MVYETERAIIVELQRIGGVLTNIQTALEEIAKILASE